MGAAADSNERKREKKFDFTLVVTTFYKTAESANTRLITIRLA